MSECSYLLSDIHTHVSPDSVNVLHEHIKNILPSTSQIPDKDKTESLQKFADSMEVLSKKNRRIDFRKIFCCKLV